MLLFGLACASLSLIAFSFPSPLLANDELAHDSESAAPQPLRPKISLTSSRQISQPLVVGGLEGQLTLKRHRFEDGSSFDTPEKWHNPALTLVFFPVAASRSRKLKVLVQTGKIVPPESRAPANQWRASALSIRRTGKHENWMKLNEPGSGRPKTPCTAEELPALALSTFPRGDERWERLTTKLSQFELLIDSTFRLTHSQPNPFFTLAEWVCTKEG